MMNAIRSFQLSHTMDASFHPPLIGLYLNPIGLDDSKIQTDLNIACNLTEGRPAVQLILSRGTSSLTGQDGLAH
jgi:hypothetical protein